MKPLDKVCAEHEVIRLTAEVIALAASLQELERERDQWKQEAGRLQRLCFEKKERAERAEAAYAQVQADCRNLTEKVIPGIKARAEAEVERLNGCMEQNAEVIITQAKDTARLRALLKEARPCVEAYGYVHLLEAIDAAIGEGK